MAAHAFGGELNAQRRCQATVDLGCVAVARKSARTSRALVELGRSIEVCDSIPWADAMEAKSCSVSLRADEVDGKLFRRCGCAALGTTRSQFSQ